MGSLRAVLRTGKQFARRAAFNVWQLPYRVTGRSVVDVAVFGNYLLTVRTDDFRAFRLWQTGGSQRDKIDLMRQIWAWRPGMFVDVGANYGEFSIIPASLGIECLLFEPNPILVPCLKKTFAQFANVRICESAAGAQPGSATFCYNTIGSGSGSLAHPLPKVDALWQSARHVKEAVVPIATVDIELTRHRARLASGLALKIDVEGYEREVLRGAMASLESAPWWRALVEFSPVALSDAGKSVESEWRFFRQFAGTVFLAPASAAGDVMPTRLPEAVPSSDVELLIGHGTPRLG